MGFGTLFIGYFFLINISYFAYTDILASLIMLMGLYKLAPVNSHFKNAAVSTACFSVIALSELALSVTEMFTYGEWLPLTVSYVNSLRYAVMFVITQFILRGLCGVALEVGADEIYRGAKQYGIVSYCLCIAAVLEIPFIGGFLGTALPYVYFVLLLLIVVFTIAVLILIYKAYMQICMPEDAEIKDKKSKFGFLNRFYDRIESKSRDYAEYKIKSDIEKKNKRKK